MNRSLQEKYEKLDSNDQVIVELLTLFYIPISFIPFHSFYNSTISPIAENKLKECLVRLRIQKLITGNENIELNVDKSLKLWLYPSLNKRENFKQYADIVYQMMYNNLHYKFSALHYKSKYISYLLYGYFFNKHELFAMSVANALDNITHSIELFVSMFEIEGYQDMFLAFPDELLSRILLQLRINAIQSLSSTKKIEKLIEAALIQPTRNEESKKALRVFLTYINVYKANTVFSDENKTPLAEITAYWIDTIHFASQGNYTLCINSLNSGLALFKKGLGIPQVFAEAILMFYYSLSALFCNESNTTVGTDLAKKIKQYEKNRQQNKLPILALLYFANNQPKQAARAIVVPADFDKQFKPIDLFIYLATTYLLNSTLTNFETTLAESLLASALKNEYDLLALELAWIIKQTRFTTEAQDIYYNIRQKVGVEAMLSRIIIKEDWEKAIESLLNINAVSKTPEDETENGSSRLAYLVDFDRFVVEPYVQTLSAKGWSKGRSAALKRLKQESYAFMTEQDKRMARTIREINTYYSIDYRMDYMKLLPEMVGHPYLFYADNPDIVMELVKGTPELIIETSNTGYVLRSNITDVYDTVVLQKETNTRYILIELTKEQLMVIQLLKDGKLTVPASGKEQIEKITNHLSGFMTVHSDIISTETSVIQVEGDSRIRVQLIPVGKSIKAECFVKPFDKVPPYTKPGQGSKTIYGVIDNNKYQAIRDLHEETANMMAVSEALASIIDADISEEAIMFDHPHDCLSLLEVLAEKSDIAITEWPEGEKFKIRRKASFGQLSFSVHSKGHWFDLEGEFTIDETTVLSLKELLALTAKTDSHFIELGNGEFIALADEFKRRLEELALFATIDKNGIKLNKFAALSIESLAQEANSFQSDEKWKSFIKKIEEAGDKTYPVPPTLMAELRPYQQEGFTWMARLAEWEAGACLADDMGLGKTVQSIAMLLHRAANGSALIVCPVSVQPNWTAELQRFAPSLNLKFLNNTNREEVLNNLSTFDVVITSYGILQSEEALLAKVKWSTVILDEAHAIKNTQTKTSKAAMNIEAGFKLILTGTPLQNHLGELWNLFNFINPGLLGTIKHFNDHYVIPVEKHGNMQPKHHLKKLIAPFILRRTKATVLDELPPKTEITKKIELSLEEMTFYEALRRQAIENIEHSNSPTGQQHLVALAEITRLRMACCHPSLVNKSLALPSSKLNAFLDIIEELKENNHRALVFSQFIGHLALVREALEAKGISYQYLDGSTPIQSRASIVKDFQSGTGDVFLISLKAGGLGLNLTAADYVIHLDPWWNPAIEDQASDRAYRMGQMRPVTIYRLVAQGTIEEKILQLHATKRDMADSLLEGSDQSAKLNTSDLLNLLKEQM